MKPRDRRLADGRGGLGKTGKWLLFYAVTLLPNLLCILIFRDDIRVSALSILPGVLMLSPLAAFFDRPARRRRSDVLGSIKYTKGESMADTIMDSTLIQGAPPETEATSLPFAGVMVPFMLPFVLFFSDSVKGFGSIGVTFCLIIAVLVITIPAGIKQARIEQETRRAAEEAERREQAERESMGKFR